MLYVFNKETRIMLLSSVVLDVSKPILNLPEADSQLVGDFTNFLNKEIADQVPKRTDTRLSLSSKAQESLRRLFSAVGSDRIRAVTNFLAGLIHSENNFGQSKIDKKACAHFKKLLPELKIRSCQLVEGSYPRDLAKERTTVESLRNFRKLQFILTSNKGKLEVEFNLNPLKVGVPSTPGSYPTSTTLKHQNFEYTVSQASKEKWLFNQTKELFNSCFAILESKQARKSTTR